MCGIVATIYLDDPNVRNYEVSGYAKLAPVIFQQRAGGAGGQTENLRPSFILQDCGWVSGWVSGFYLTEHRLATSRESERAKVGFGRIRVVRQVLRSEESCDAD